MSEARPTQSAAEQLLTPAEVAAMFRVSSKTVTRWAQAGKISTIRTLGGHRRFLASEIIRFRDELATPPIPAVEGVESA